MDNNTLEHWGIKGMKWGRRRFQNKDGSLTPEGKKRYADESDDKDNEAAKTAERRERALKSSNAREVYNNRDVLTTEELRERLNRISVEKQLAEAASTARIDKAKRFVNSINEAYKMTKTPAAEALKDVLFEKRKEKKNNRTLQSIYDNMDDVVSSLSDADLKKYSDRANSEKNFKQTLRDLYKKEPTRRSLRELYEDRDNVSDKDLKDAFVRATTEKNIKKILDELDDLREDDDDYLEQGEPDMSDTELRHYGVKGMKWGVRRSPEQLRNKVVTLTKTNERLADKAQSYEHANVRYMSKSAAVQSKNNRAAKRMKKAERKMYKYEAKAANARANWTKRYTRNTKAEEYEAKAAKYTADYKHYSAKIKCNKWAVKSAKAQAAAAEARDAIKHNEQMIDMYNKTLSAIDEGTIKRGRLFMQYIVE